MECNTVIQAKSYLATLTAAKDHSRLQPEAVDEDAQECSFRPQRSKQAQRAMRNPSCGYDFVSRLGEKGGFMPR